MNKEEINRWFELTELVKENKMLYMHEYQELIRLNHLVMELAHKIHNDNMSDFMKSVIESSQKGGELI